MTTTTATHTFTVYVHNDGWTGDVDRFAVRCTCGIESGAGHATATDAAREPMHSHGRGATAYHPQWDGSVARELTGWEL